MKALALHRVLWLLPLWAGAAVAQEADEPYARYQAVLREAIAREWRPSAEVPAGARCKVVIRQLPGGDVLEAWAHPDCAFGDRDRDLLEEAVLRAQPLPYRGHEREFSRLLALTFEAPGR
ncbi:hypothetical protein [Pseudoxanthomonas putridarboris]|uniref:TonB C terminal n=1 Tax=Pseudoxanthomonas putridarboris TaxID=752605 RepID=A0ABU9J3N0_9GAMM